MDFELNFTKMQAYGNDYVYVETITQPLKNLNELARLLSSRHYGVGGDGMILVCPSDKAEFKMRVFNPDGSEAEMCGNGLRSVGKFVYEKGLTQKKDFSVETLGGIKHIHLFLQGGKVSMITAEIGVPLLSASDVPVRWEGDRFIEQPISLDGRSFLSTAISLGNPHCVSFIDHIDDFPIEKYGPLMEHCSFFPHRINAEFCEVVDASHLRLRTWERGTGETLACATGCCTCVVGGVLTNRCSREVDVEQTGGVTHIEWSEKDDRLYMTAPSEFVFDGVITLSKEAFYHDPSRDCPRAAI